MSWTDILNHIQYEDHKKKRKPIQRTLDYEKNRKDFEDIIKD